MSDDSLVPAEVWADGSCALCDGTGTLDDTDCPHVTAANEPYLAGVRRATNDLYTIADSTPLDTWQECVMTMVAIDDLYRAAAAVKKRALATGTSLARHHKIVKEESDG